MQICMENVIIISEHTREYIVHENIDTKPKKKLLSFLLSNVDLKIEIYVCI